MRPYRSGVVGFSVRKLSPLPNIRALARISLLTVPNDRGNGKTLVGGNVRRSPNYVRRKPPPHPELLERGLPVPKPEWGTKQLCPECGAKFYDFKKDPIHCPKCDYEWPQAAPPKPRRGAKAKAKEAEAKEAEEEEAEELEDEDDVEDDGTESLDEVATGEKKTSSGRKRAPSLDDDEDEDEEDDDDLPDLGDDDIDTDLDDDDEDDDTFLTDDDEDDDDLSDVIPGKKDND